MFYHYQHFVYWNISLFQEGAQNIIGFDFRASVTMDMTEDPDNNIWGNTQKKLRFKLVNSVMFSNFDGIWSLSLDEFGSADRTILNYSVYVRPKGAKIYLKQ